MLVDRLTQKEALKEKNYAKRSQSRKFDSAYGELYVS